MPHVRHLLQYLAIVGLPFVGLLGVLRLGRDIRAPLAVRGSYRVVAVEGAADGCLRRLLADSVLVITQSGDRVDVQLSDPAFRLDGRLEGDRIDAAGVAPPAVRCGAGPPVRIVGRATRIDRQVRLEARLGPDCPGCPALTLEAIRPRRPTGRR